MYNAVMYMNKLRAPSANVQSTYYDSHGIHSVPTEDGEVHIFSFDKPADLVAAIKSDLPSSGTIITPEMATVDITQGLDSIASQASSVRRLEDEVQYASLGTTAEIILGSIQKSPRYNKWHNVAKTYRLGSKIDTQVKYGLSGVEQESGSIEAPLERERRIRLGRAVLICSELIFTYGEDEAIAQGIETILTPAAWGVQTPGFAEFNKPRIEAAGGIDNFNRNNMEKVVNGHTFRDIPSLKRVIVADRGMSGNKPVNSVHTRVE